MGSYALPLEVYVAGLVFVRVSAIVMLIPGIGDAAVPPRIRLAFALILSLVLFPLAAPTIAAIPRDLGRPRRRGD
jgi:flagellar biosynthetic protein FliR